MTRTETRTQEPTLDTPSNNSATRLTNPFRARVNFHAPETPVPSLSLLRNGMNRRKRGYHDRRQRGRGQSVSRTS